MNGAAISPESKDDNPYNLPTGEELMNRPIEEPGLSGIVKFNYYRLKTYYNSIYY